MYTVGNALACCNFFTLYKMPYQGPISKQIITVKELVGRTAGITQQFLSTEKTLGCSSKNTLLPNAICLERSFKSLKYQVEVSFAKEKYN